MNLLMTLLTTKTGAKVTGVVAGGSSLFVLIAALHTDLKGEITSSEQRSRDLIARELKIHEMKFQSMDKDVSYIKRSIDKQSKLLERIDARVYELNQKTK